MQARGDNWIRIAIVGTPSVPPGTAQLVTFSGNRHGLFATDASVDIRDLEDALQGLSPSQVETLIRAKAW